MQCTMTLWLLFASTSSQRYSTSLANIKLNICCSILLPKSRLNVKLKINDTTAHVFKPCLMTLQGHPRSLILALTSYWSSTVTLVLSCRVSEIIELLYAESHLFPYPNPILAKFLRCWSRSMMLGSAKSEHPRLTNGEIIFEEFTWWRYLNITDGRQTTCCSNTALYIESQGKKIKTNYLYSYFINRNTSYSQ